MYPIAIDHLTKGYGRETVVDNLCFTAQAGEVTGFLGPNGARKSTTLKVLLGLASADAGHATIDGERYRDISDPSRTVGVVLELLKVKAEPRAGALDLLAELPILRATSTGSAGSAFGREDGPTRSLPPTGTRSCRPPQVLEERPDIGDMRSISAALEAPRVRPETTPARVTALAASFAAIPLVGYIDGHSSAYIAFSIFYVVPLSIIAWKARRIATIVAAVVLCGASGLAADLWTIHSNPAYAVVNLVSRLFLFLLIGITVMTLRNVMDRERQSNQMRRELTRRVAADVREPLAQIYASVIDLAFDHDTLKPTDLRDLAGQLAEASQRATTLVDELAREDSP